jgi:hypothetical protein
MCAGMGLASLPRFRLCAYLPGLAWTVADFHRLAAALVADPGKPRRLQKSELFVV